MKNVALALFVLWFLSLHYIRFVPLPLSIALGAAFVGTASIALVEWHARRRVRVDRAGSLGL